MGEAEADDKGEADEEDEEEESGSSRWERGIAIAAARPPMTMRETTAIMMPLCSVREGAPEGFLPVIAAGRGRASAEERAGRIAMVLAFPLAG